MVYYKKHDRKTGVVTIHNTPSSIEAIAYHEKQRRTLINQGDPHPIFYIEAICDASGKIDTVATDKLDKLAKPTVGVEF